MYVQLNEHAVMAWMYVAETILLCRGKAAVDYQFTRLILDLKQAYPDEFEYVVRNFVIEED